MISPHIYHDILHDTEHPHGTAHTLRRVKMYDPEYLPSVYKDPVESLGKQISLHGLNGALDNFYLVKNFDLE